MWSIIKETVNHNIQHNDLQSRFVHCFNEYLINIGSQLVEYITTDVNFDHYLQKTYHHVAIKLYMIDEGQILSII